MTKCRSLTSLGALFLIAACGVAADLRPRPIYGPTAAIQNKTINESSGLIESRLHRGIFWTHNDSGDEPRLFAIDLNGKLIGEYFIEGAQAIDWEDIAISREGDLLIADVGNNDRKRSDLVIYVVPEPVLLERQGTLKVIRKIPVAYPDGNFDCEGLAVEPGGDLILIPKVSSPPAVYRWSTTSWIKSHVLENFQGVATGADINDSGDLVVSTYNGYMIYVRQADGDYRRKQFVLSELRQSEAVCWSDKKIVLTNEQRDIYIVDPVNFKEHDHWLPDSRVWNVNQKKPVSFKIGNGKKKSKVQLRWKKGTEGRIRTEFKLPKPDGKTQQIALFFSTSHDPYKLGYSDHEDTVFVLTTKKGESTLTKRSGGNRDSTVPVNKGLFRIKDKGDVRFVVIDLDKAFVERQKRFGAVALGYEKEPSGWPYGFWRINGKPFMWAVAK